MRKKSEVIPVEVGQLRQDPRRWEGRGDRKRVVRVLEIGGVDPWGSREVLIQTQAENEGKAWPKVLMQGEVLSRWPLVEEK